MKEEEENIQVNLEKAGSGLPLFEIFILKDISFPLLKTFLSWQNALTFYRSESSKVIKLVEELDNEILFKRKLIPKIIGLEDNSRYYSPAMVLWHLMFIGKQLKVLIVLLSKGKKLDTTIKIEDYKPSIDIDFNIIEEYKKFNIKFINSMEKNVKDKFIKNYLPHPWFGRLNPHSWLIMSAIHLMVHRRQLNKIMINK